MKRANAYPSASILIRFFPVACLIAIISMQSSAGAETLCVRVEACGTSHAADWPPHISVPKMHQPSHVLFGAVQPGRLGVTERPGRRGVTDQDGRHGAAPDQALRQPMPRAGRLQPVIVEALLNRKISVSLMLDTGASYTVLTRQTAQALGITGLDRLPKHSFLTPGGPIHSPVTTLKSIRVGTVEAHNVAVAIDAEGHLPLGLLGMTFMRHFKVTVDQAQGQVEFEHR
jgi:clan AA aspartic protease (TIGR02281 family)